MKRILMLVLLCGLAALEVGCGSSVKYRYDYDQMVEFREYRRFNWMPPPSDPSKQHPVQINTMTDRRIKRAVEIALLQREMQIVDTEPDVLIAYHLGATGMGDPNDFGYNYGGGEVAMEVAGKGAFILDMVDAKTNDLVWRGIATGAYEGDESDPEEIEKAITKVIDDLLKDYPPKRK